MKSRLRLIAYEAQVDEHGAILRRLDPSRPKEVSDAIPEMAKRWNPHPSDKSVFLLTYQRRCVEVAPIDPEKVVSLSGDKLKHRAVIKSSIISRLCVS